MHTFILSIAVISSINCSYLVVSETLAFLLFVGIWHLSSVNIWFCFQVPPYSVPSVIVTVLKNSSSESVNLSRFI